jgi:hypothetical protein
LEGQPKLRIRLECGEDKLDFEGTPEDVAKTILEFVTRVYPAYRIVKKLTLTVDLESLLAGLSGVLALTPEGPVIPAPRERLAKLSIRELIALHLTKEYVANQLKQVEKPSLSVDELLSAIGGRIGAMAGRLSEMVNEALVERVGRGEYRITTYGLKQFQASVLPKVKQLIREAK